MVSSRTQATLQRKFRIDPNTPRAQRIFACQIEDVPDLYWSRRQFHYYRVIGVFIRATGTRLYLPVKRDGRGFWTTKAAIDWFNSEMNRLEGL